jgi:lysophospholipase L1-like esterase
MKAGFDPIAQGIAAQAQLPHITAANNIIFDYGHSFVARGYSSALLSTDYNILGWACLLSGQRWTTDYAHASGVTGDSIAQALTRLPLAVATDAATVHIQLGTNDAHSDSVTLATMQSGYLTILNALIAVGKIILIMPILPTYGYYTTAGTQKVEQFNRWLFQTVAKMRNIYVVDALPYWTDLNRTDRITPIGLNSTADKTNYVIDTVHATASGAFAGGLAILDTLNRIQTVYPKNVRLWTPSLIFDKVNNPNSNMIAAYARFLNSGGSMDSSCTGTLAANWSAGTSGAIQSTFNMVASIVNKLLPNGQTYKMQQFVITNTGAVAMAAKFSPFTLTPSTFYTPGSASIRGSIDVEVDAGGGSTGLETYLIENGQTSVQATAQVIGDLSATAAILPAVAWSGRSRTPVLPTATGNTALTFQVRMPVAAGTSATIRLANPVIEVV